MSDPVTRKAAIARINAMLRDTNGVIWDLSPKDYLALRHAKDAFSDVDILRRENTRLRNALRVCGRAGCPTAQAESICGCGDSNCNDCAGVPG